MINETYYKLFRNKDWDPANNSYLKYFESPDIFTSINEVSFSLLLENVGSLESKDVLDLGGGAGNYSNRFLEQGSRVVYTDISKRMVEIARRNIKKDNFNFENINFKVLNPNSINELNQYFDLIFIRHLWCYSFSDKKFAKKIKKKLKENGYLYVLTTNTEFLEQTLPIYHKFKNLFYMKTKIKIGHPHPPKGLLLELFSDCKLVYYIESETGEEMLFKNC